MPHLAKIRALGVSVFSNSAVVLLRATLLTGPRHAC